VTDSSTNPNPIVAVRHQLVASSRPTTMPAQKNANHGSRGCVPFTLTSKSRPRTDRGPGSVSQAVSNPSLAWSRRHHRSAHAASADTTPRVTIHRLRSVNISAAHANIAP
jgi:hypothetical protein